MANRRMIASDINEDDFVGSMTYFGRLVWIGMIVAVADDQGRMIDNPAIIRAKVFPYDNNLTDDKVDEAQAEIIKAGKAMRYTAKDKRLLQIVNWWTYQTPSWASPSKYPPPAGWTDRVKYHTTGNKIVVLNWDLPGGFTSKLGSQLHSGIEEGDVKGEGKGEGDGESRGGDLPPPPLPKINIFSVYESEIGPMTPVIADRLKQIEVDVPKEWWEDAFKQAATNNHRSLAYADAIIKRYQSEGFQKRNGNGKGAPAEETEAERIHRVMLKGKNPWQPTKQ